MKRQVTTRRDFLKLAAVFTAASALQACAPSVPAPTSEAGAPAPTQEVVAPTAVPKVEVKEVAPGVPRNECLILENPSGTVQPADDFNRWRSGYSGSWVCGLQQLGLDALWYIDPDAGVNGVWDNALASDKPIYNADYTQMTVKLRQGLYLAWSSRRMTCTTQSTPL
jgi:peptide/nickel transport system substrate-binding protein